MKKKVRLQVISIILSVLFLSNTYQVTFAKEIFSNVDSSKTIHLDDNTFYTTVPDNFNPANASDETLQKYGLPNAPSDPSEKKIWKEKIAGAKWISPQIEETPNNIKIGGDIQYSDTESTKSSHQTDRDLQIENNYGIEDNEIIFSTQSNNWCGHIYNSTSYGASAEVIVPTTYAPSSYQPAASAQWGGIGGASVGKLAQNGIYEYADSSGVSYSAFYETIGTNVSSASHTLTNFAVSPGDDIYFSTYISSASTGINLNYYFWNYTTNTYTTITVNVTSYSGITNTAEWIFERPYNGNTQYYYNLARPTTSSSGYSSNTVHYTSCQKESSAGVWSAATSSVQCYIYNSDSGNTLATSGSISSYEFTASWKNYY